MTNQTDDDFFDPEVDAVSSNDNTAEVIRTFKQLMEAEGNASELKAQLEGENAIITKIKSATLPDLLKEMGTEIWRDPETGITVELEVAVNSSLPKDLQKRNDMLDALRPLGIEQIMAEEFIVNFSPNDKRAHAIRAILGLEQQTTIFDEDEEDHRLTNEQMDLVQRLRETLELQQLPATEKLGVHPARLKSWLKELIGKGKGNDITEAGIWHGKFAAVKQPKGKK
jgi:hypothetical protein